MIDQLWSDAFEKKSHLNFILSINKLNLQDGLDVFNIHFESTLYHGVP